MTPEQVEVWRNSSLSPEMEEVTKKISAKSGLAKGADMLKPRETPVIHNPDLPGNTTKVRYDNGQVRIEAAYG